MTTPAENKLTPAQQAAVFHTPVLLPETLDGLAINPAGLYVDCTFGGGGHSRAILQALNDEGKLIAFDQDDAVKKNLPVDTRITFVPQNFRHMQRFLRLHKHQKVDGILADLGVSSHQINEAERGFSTRFNATLDMRMNRAGGKTAAFVLNSYSAPQLQHIFQEFGEVTNSKTLAALIVEKRAMMSIQTLDQFRDAVKMIVKGNPNKYFAQVFQALRIEVNDELGALKEMLEQAALVLKPGGRIAVISFHSLEDRVVKQFLKYGKSDAAAEDTNVFGEKAKAPFTIITRKPIVATDKEISANSRSRSAKLRIAEKN